MTAYTARALSTNRLQFSINQVGHGFAVGDLIVNDADEGPPNYVHSQAGSLGDCQGTMMVSFIVDVNNFVVTQCGHVSNITSQTVVAGTQYYVSAAVANTLTATAPAAVGNVLLPCFVADSATSGFFYTSSGTLIESGNLFQWNIVGVNTPLLVNNGYFSAGGMTINLTLPTVCAIGDTIRIANLTGNFTIVQNAGQAINFGIDTTTIGAGGSITSMNKGDSIEIVCYNANTDFQVLNSMGNFTYV